MSAAASGAMVTSGWSACVMVREITNDFTPGIDPPPPPIFAIASNVLRPISSVSKWLKISEKSMSGSLTIQSASPFGPAM